MKLYKALSGIVLNYKEAYYLCQQDWDLMINRNDLHAYLLAISERAGRLPAEEAHRLLENEIMPPIGRQEVWAAGVTYLRSRNARMEESRESGAANLYDRVYEAERPELFFKSLPHRVAGHQQAVYIRRDSSWNVPEPELTLFINSDGVIQAYSIGNDMSSRSIEGDNALYLPQAKIYERSAALGPCLYIPEIPVHPETIIRMVIKRENRIVYDDSVSIDRMKRPLTELAAYLFRECDFNYGCYLMTGTCLVPPDGFTLKEEDRIEISIDPIGTLINQVKLNAVKLRNL